jgi:hypothetical protein
LSGRNREDLMRDANAPSVFESFNARALSPESVARTFIPSEKFAELAARCHSIVIGPRGSGKTSLLKMLQTTALETWNHEEAGEYRSRIDYTGVFIATDISWKEQLRSIGHPHLDTGFMHCSRHSLIDWKALIRRIM